VTTEVIGPFKNGGIGTATTGLGQWLASEGHAVTILYTLREGSRPYCATKTFDFWQAAYASDWKIDLVAVPDPDRVDPSFPPALRIPYSVHRWLSDKKWDLIIFCDSSGPGYLCTQAKSCGTHYGQTVLAVIAHGSHRWLRSVDETVCESPDIFAFEDAEDNAVVSCDVLISPSEYMLGWLNTHVGSRPMRRLFIPNILPKTIASAPPSLTGRPVPVDELVFFGRFEIRKGIEVFCDAIDRLIDDRVAARRLRRITFLGRCGRIAGEHGAAYVLRRSYNWPFELNYEIAADQTEALDYLREGRRLAVMPSTADNLPSVVIECLENGIPFLAGDIGGAAELVDPADHDRVLVSPNAEDLAQAIGRVLEQGACIARSAITREKAIEGWRCFIEEVAESLQGLARIIRPPAQVRALSSSRTFDLGNGRQAHILLEPGAHLAAEGVEALLQGLLKAPVVASVWTDDNVIRAPRIDRGYLLMNEPRVPVCAVDASIVKTLDPKIRTGELCRQLILMGQAYLIMPEPWCAVSAHDDVEEAGTRQDVPFGEQAHLDSASVILGRQFATRRSLLNKACYDSIPCGATLAALESVDHFKDVKTTTALMAGFLNGVGRRREALAMLASWVDAVSTNKSPAEGPIKVAELIESDAVSLENILVPVGFDVLERESFMLHPNEPGHLDATCNIQVFLFGHSRLQGFMEVRNRKSAPVRFQIMVCQDDTVLNETSHVVLPGSPLEFAIAFDAMVGPVELRLTTRMADNAARNFFAWATWRDLEFTTTGL
jgi:glycosyltransferase involved in cell wall biosynthesis